MFIENLKIAKNMSYPLKSSCLEDMLDAAKITIHTHLIQGGGSSLFECFFWPPNPRVNYERLYVRTAPIRSDRAKEARLLIETRVIPEFNQWLTHLLKLPHNSPIRQQQQHYSHGFV
ncbi:MAG: hypothetical protein V4812_01615 [Pseudomonadota bacterium]